MAFASRRNFLKAGLAGTAAAAAAAVPAAAHAAKAPKAKELTYDVIVVGAGCAGLAATIEAADRGAKVLLIEKSAVPMGNTIYAGGFVNAACTWVQKRDGITDDLDSFYQDMMMVSKGRGDPELTKMYCEQSAGAVQWLTDRCHLSWKKIPMQIKPMLGRSHQVDSKAGPGGSQMVENMMAEVEKLHVPMMFNTKVVELLHDDMLRCTGVKAVSPEGPLVIHAKGGVILATGGFHANKALVTQFMGGEVAWMPIRGSMTLTGENILLTAPFFPMYVNMDQFHAGPIIGATHVNPADVLNSGYGIQVNTSGDRYMDENNTYVIKARTTAQKTLDNTGWVIVDSTCPVLDKVIPKFDMLNSPYGKANTIEEVAKQAGLPPAKIVALVKEYNDAVKNGTLGKMNPPNTYKKPHLIEKAPFYAVPLQGGMTATFGGPLINTKAEVQNLDGKTIPGLYAVGNSSGGIFFHNYAGGAQLGAATVFGRIAGKEMAQRAAAAK